MGNKPRKIKIKIKKYMAKNFGYFGYFSKSLIDKKPPSQKK